MEKEFIPYQIALNMKSIGFDEPCFGWWFTDDEMLIIEKSKKSTSENIIQAPTFSQAFRWFREKYSLTWEHQFDDSNISLYVGEMAYPDNNLDFFKIVEVEYSRYNKAYEEAELECLKKLIEITKNTNK